MSTKIAMLKLSSKDILSGKQDHINIISYHIMIVSNSNEDNPLQAQGALHWDIGRQPMRSLYMEKCSSLMVNINYNNDNNII